MSRPFLSVAIYRPRYGNFKHWALHLHTGSEDLVFEVDGEHPLFTKVTSTGKPTDNESFLESLHVGEIGIPDIPTVRRIVDEARVDNETLEWDCQEYVLEILEACEVEAVLEEEDPDYAEVKEILRRRRGPTL
ncbi:uncharacterized protein APUU_50201S [Aspergillus puulaauensis]|uniref:Uncharacterized protein n=1 Tax=Aspergillus puulaauensis TaxID=1220207 RepID=A0A7R7XPX7_9EURO|nr:uncharacterized protein APUU_50201S [Aspergillus puulaauensis]BCS25490.1 hypothetical protein APUU_50201S [Aspergillus puulaauensis]